ncbi:type I restriction enzyme HsdR N-terminal domain-containing protein [Flavobacterium hungaricum]|uniref:NTPase (NACHT family) n=1 Tax=Flavobacterium hungaricum TaxID=2082725 RepID=A0ABR9TDI0_9FLAO|nr:type I restriction enzyme HsdR N-terminal domain-containing protein [Flavobacterium hungaricum]MBE8723418.1 NTPase (NACHT family) [Flavobacterium hungaricum]
MDSHEILVNEEDIRLKLLMPYLQSLGFSPCEIQIEKSFSIRLGKSVQKMRGRADILCTRNGRNLFIIELKKDTVKITDQDIAQGISYARLLEDNIAPFTIVTNGKVTRVFDTITKTELTGENIAQQSAFWTNGCTLATDDDILIRYDALKNFISFSSENLKLFCQNQVQDRIGPLLGNLDDPTAKFVKELFIVRQSLSARFASFTESDSPVFAIVGDAGVGKTNAMCSLALQYLDDNFVFFYNAPLISKSPVEHIADDLNLTFSSRTETDTVLKRLDDIGRHLKKKILIFIDALDESTDSSLVTELSELSLAVRKLSYIKLCVSCKTGLWKNFLYRRDTRTHLFEEVARFESTVAAAENNPGYFLEDFSAEELRSIIPVYKRAYNFQGEISDRLLKELKNGFFLRIFSEVYSGRQVPEILNDKDLISRYIKQSIEKTDLEHRIAVKTLSEIGKVLLRTSFTSVQEHKNEGLEINGLLDELNYSVRENLPQELFTRNLLVRSNLEDSYNITFYYSKIRDHIICYHAYALDKMNDADFYNNLHVFFENYIGESAIAYYLQNASPTHKDTFVKYKKDKAEEFVQAYNSYLDLNFQQLKSQFNPNTAGRIGILLPEDILNEDGYALFPLNDDSQNSIQFANLRTGNEIPHSEIVFFKYGVKSIYGSNKALLKKDQSPVLREKILKDLKEIFEKGGLNTYESELLNLEKLAVLLYHNFDKLDYNFKIKDFRLPRFELIYPIDLKLLKEKLYRFRARYHYREENNDPASIDEMVEKAIAQELQIPKLNVGGSFPPFEELYTVVNSLLEKGYTIIEKYHLPYPDKTVQEAETFYNLDPKSNRYFQRSCQYSRDQAWNYTKDFLRQLEICYKEFVEQCFPTFKDQFKFYNAVPNEFFLYLKDEDILKWGSYGYRPSRTGKIEFYLLNLEDSEKAFDIENLDSLWTFILDKFLCIEDDFRYYPIKTVRNINTSELDKYCVLRNWVHKILEDDLRTLFKGEYEQ